MTFAQSRQAVLKVLDRYNAAKFRCFEMNECSFTTVSAPVVARPRRLSARWIAEFDLAEYDPLIEVGVEERFIDMLATWTL
jgi:hypothetical protein